jgi:nitrite reductase/ring-hydroxylating ferredoxin subunit
MPFAAASRAMTARLPLCDTDEVAEGTALEVETHGMLLAVFNLGGGRYHVTDNSCTHGPGLLSEGHIDGDIVECDFHSGQFNIVTGEVVSPPCMVPIKTYRTAVEGGRVIIDLD